jgi:predicted RecA/RadA family phage recombinase
MKNFINTGRNDVFTAPYDVVSGAGFLIGLLFAVANADASSGQDVVGDMVGTFDLAAKSTDTALVGAAAYWDDTAKNITATATANTKVGVFLTAKTNGQTTATIRLNGSF